MSLPSIKSIDTTTTNLAHRLTDIRQFMARESLDAFIVPCSDQFLGEYLGPDVQRLRWLTGFTGEAAIAVILPERAALFVDGRFTVQVRQQVPASLFEYHHLIEESHLNWLNTTLQPGDRMGFDATLHTYNWYQDAVTTFKEKEIQLVELTENPIDKLWHDRPTASDAPGMLLDEKYTGRNSADKRKVLSDMLQQKGLDALVITQPDAVNWLFNIRSGDVPCLPVVLSYAIVYQDGSADLFAPTDKLDNRFYRHAGDDVRLMEISTIEHSLKQLGEDGTDVQLHYENSNAWIPLTLLHFGAQVIHGDDPCMAMKAIKNPIEIEGMRQAHLYDGIATTKFLAWLDREIAAGTQTLDECVLADKIEALLEEQPGYHGCSFETISAVGPNAAMCHYNHTLTTPRKLGQDGLYLIDSGGHFPEGTTDMTRTIKVGEVTDEMCTRYTQVLQGHIRLAATRFPKGTRGIQLDTIARQPLWQAGCDYDHGTGHGVGHFLGVHETPLRMSPQETESRLKAGMMITIEPGYYKEDAYGLRVENLYVVKPSMIASDIPMLEMESLTFAPIDCRLIKQELLSTEEIQWLDDYHQQVREIIGSYLSDGEMTWLNQVTRPLAEQHA
ncbi:MAG: hypothetical protein B0D91_14715 [Oceanospirillales bacterium LUC14_002_19_P2]|nr:MAG: hypothetical protein B0D91_14715 [Oceanospirillales bacterium LUC14_002_19_P2]